MQVSEIVTKIVKAKKMYYSGEIPIMSDYDYDALENELKKLDPDHPILYAVGYDSTYDWWIRHYEGK
jgi:DNA ligase (NAD+)